MNKNNCEKEALHKISNSTDTIIYIDEKCKIMSWAIITEPEASKLNAELLKLWNITNKKILYYSKK